MHEVTISFSETEGMIAEQIVQQLKKKGIKCYYYKHEEQLGMNLQRIIKRQYYTRVRHALIISSEAYVNRYWCRKELDYILAAKREGRLRSLFLVVVKEANLLKIDQNILHAKWDNNAKEIASQIAVQITKSGWGKSGLQRYIFGIAALFILCLIYYIFRVII